MKRTISLLVLTSCILGGAKGQINSTLLPTKEGDVLVNEGLIGIDHSIIYENNGWHILGMDGHTFDSDGQPIGRPFSHLTMINEGTIYLETPAKPSSGYPNYIYAIYNSGGNCTTINNGKIFVVTDPSDIHAGPHGMSVSYGSTVINNGLVDIYAENARMCGGVGGGAYDNTIINNGRINVTSRGQIYAMRAGMSTGDDGNNTLINTGYLNVNNLGKSVAPNSPDANTYGMWLLGDQGVATNSGVIAVKGNNDYVATGIRFSNNSGTNKDYHSTADNIGIIKVSGNAGAFELGVSNYYIDASAQALTGRMEVKLNRWATSLRDFRQNLFQVGENGTLDLSNATLMLRPDESYMWGREYSIAQDALVTVEANGQVVGFDQMRILSEFPDFVDVNIDAAENTASLTLSENPESAKRMLATSVLSNLTTARAMLNGVETEQINRNLLDNSGWYLYANPLFSNQSVDNGMDVNLWGILAGADYTIDSKLRIGFHAAYARGDARYGMYNAAAKTDNGVLGLNVTYNPNSHSYLRGQASAYLSGGTTQYAVEGTALKANADASMDGAYLSLIYGYAFQWGENNRLEAEAGLDGMFMSMNPDIDWYISNYEMSRYRMDITDSYNALYAKATARWVNEKKAINHVGYRFFLEGGLRGRLAATDLSLCFDGTQMPGHLSEDPIMGVFGAGGSLLLPNGLGLSLSYRGNIGDYQQIHAGWFSLSMAF